MPETLVGTGLPPGTATSQPAGDRVASISTIGNLSHLVGASEARIGFLRRINYCCSGSGGGSGSGTGTGTGTGSGSGALF